MLASAQTYPWALAVDDKNVYWTQQEIEMRRHGELDAARRDGQPTASRDAPPSRTCSTPGGLYALHDGTLYWTDYDARAATSSASPSVGATTRSSEAPPQDHPFAVIADDANVYWSTYEAVMTVPLSGGTPATLAAAAQRIIDLTTDGKYVYWTDYYEGTITEVSVRGGAPITLATGQNSPYGIAVDTKRVFWTTYGDGNGRPDGAEWP